MLIEKAKSTIKKFNLLNVGDKVIVAVSGGPDSLALLYLLNSLRKDFALTLYVAHLNHMIRPKESKKEFLFVKTIAEKLKLPFIGENIDVKTKAKKGSLEEIARKIRFGFLSRLARRFKADKIALGHTKDDQVETIIMRIIRGTGLYGLRAILPKRKINGITVIRPLLEVERREIDSYLKGLKLKPCIDSSNLKEIYFRNSIRNYLIPILQNKYNPRIKDILSDLAENISVDYEYLNNLAVKQLEKLKISKTKSKIAIKLNNFKKLHFALQRMILRLSIESLTGTTRKLRYQHWRELYELLNSRPVGSIVDLPHRLKAVKTPSQIIISSIIS